MIGILPENITSEKNIHFIITHLLEKNHGNRGYYTL